MKLKYIRTRRSELIVFPETLVHSSVLFDGEPISAGFISFGDFGNGRIEARCHGKSVSMQLESRRDDSALAQLQFFGEK